MGGGAHFTDKWQKLGEGMWLACWVLLGVESIAQFSIQFRVLPGALPWDS